MGSLARRAALAALALAALGGFSRVTLELASFARPPLVFDVGPATGKYLEGFTESEERAPVSFRWTTERASVSLPLRAYGEDAVLALRFARFLEGTAQLRWFVNGEPAGVLPARSGRFRTVEIPLSLQGEPPNIAVTVDDPAPERLGIAVDWLRIEGARLRLPTFALQPYLLLAGVFLIAVAVGLSVTAALGLGASLAAAQAVWFARDPFAMLHAHGEVVPLALAATALLALATRRKAQLLPFIFLLGLLFKGAVLFHPSYWYPDVRLHRRYVEAYQDADGGIVERGIAAQMASGTAYARELAGRRYAFPYSPLFHLPFTTLSRDARGIEAAMKKTGLLLAAFELPLVYLLARYLLGARVALWAALLTAFLPPVMSRLFFAQWPTLAGHVLDLASWCFAARFIKLSERRAIAAYFGLGFASCLVYISSLFNFTVFTSFLALFVRKRAVLLLSLGAAIGVATLLLLYLPFLTILVNEVFPAIGRGATFSGTPRPGLGVVLGRIPLFFGYGFPALALAGLILSRRTPHAFRFLAVYACVFVALAALRAASGAFKDLKELVLVGPLVAITTGASLESLAARGRSGRLAAVAVATGLVGFGLSKLGEYAAQHTALASLE